ncbi:MAG TPA: non-heme iron oxygenase ferredoxin subunit [Terriglobia bacterium]|nr:non-heme iron oxygenase ferredoxin subunit [Terriglobia bacterium]
MAELIRVAGVQEIAPNTALAVEVKGQPIAIFNVGGNYYAIGDTCTHRGGPLSQGVIEGSTVTCPWHGATFDITTGKVLTPPAPQGVGSYKVVVEGNDIKIEI